MHEILFRFISRYITLTNEEKEAITSLNLFRSVRKGTVLLKAEEKSKDGYFVLQGCIRTYYFIDGEEKTTSFYTEMEGITPHCVTTGEPSEYNVACVEDSIITISDTSLELDMLKKFPRFEIMCRKLSEELLAKEQLNFNSFKTQSPEERYLSLMAKRPDLIQRVPQHQLASYIGIKPESLSRMRARIKKQKI